MARLLLALLPLAACARQVDCAGDPLEPIGHGVFVSPEPGAHSGRTDLILGNGTGEALSCTLTESDACPSLAPYVDALASVADGACWRVDRVTCADVTISCLFDDGKVAAEWSWVVGD